MEHPITPPPELLQPVAEESSVAEPLTAQAAWDTFNNVTERVSVFENYGDALAAAFRAKKLGYFKVKDPITPIEDDNQ
jgi:hypothetical protein